MQRQLVQGFILLLVLVYGSLAYAQSITVGPGGKFEKGVISVPYAFYNKNFGAAIGYAYAVTGSPQKQAAMIANQANAKKLVLTHFSARYKTTHEVEEDAKGVFSNSIAAKDFMVFKI